MLKVLIAKGNQDIIERYYGVTKFRNHSEHLCTFKISESDMLNLIQSVEDAGYNRFALMSW